MLQRCFNPNNPQYRNYGGREDFPITVCENWCTFENYRADILGNMDECPPGKTIDRINNNGDYMPWNWQWATQSMQNWNQRRSHRAIVR